MSTNRYWGTFCSAMMVVTCILASCGGDGDSGSTPAYPQFPNDSRLPTAEHALINKGVAEREMVGFSYIGNNSYANASFKLLISAIGPQNLKNHLESFGQTTQDSGKRLAAKKFVELIDKAYDSPSALRNEVKELIDILQTLAPFNKLNEQGALEFKVDEAHEPALFIDQLAESFDFKSIPGWSLEMKHTLTPEKKEMSDFFDQLFSSRMYRLAPLNMLGREALFNVGLQRIVDTIHTDLEIDVPSQSPDAAGMKLKVSREPRISDVDNFTRLTIIPVGTARLRYSLDDHVTLPVLDMKSNRKIELTLQPKETVVLSKFRYQVNIRNANGEWKIHDDASVSSRLDSYPGDVLDLMNLAVISKKPAP